MYMWLHYVGRVGRIYTLTCFRQIVSTDFYFFIFQILLRKHYDFIMSGMCNYSYKLVFSLISRRFSILENYKEFSDTINNSANVDVP